VVVCASYVPLIAQDTKTETGPPKRLQLIIEEVKPGKNAAHERSEVQWLSAYIKANVPSYGIALTSTTGRNEAWFLNPTGTWTNWASVNKQIEENKVVTAEIAKVASSDGDMLNSTRTMYLEYVPELSYRPDFKLGEMRGFTVDVVRVKPGHGKEFSEIRKAVNAAHEKANMDEHMIVYYASMGSASGTYYIFEPFKSVADLDEVDKTHGEDSSYRKALGDDFQKMNREFALNGLVYMETNMFSINPAMSWVGEDVAKMAPTFWNQRPSPTRKLTAAKKDQKETATGQ
jgi:hypothetical protein